MPFTRKMLLDMDIESDKVDKIISAHVDVVNAIKNERDAFKIDADKLVTVQTELDALKQTNNNWQQKYEMEHNAFEEYKTQIAAAETHKKKSDVYREALRKVGVPEKMIEPLIRIADVSNVVFDENGTVTNQSDIETNVKSQFGDYIRTESIIINKPDTPLTNTSSNTFEKMSLAEKMKYANENPDSPEVKAWIT